MTSTRNSDSYVGGILNMTGVRPGEAYRYDGPTMIDQIRYSLTFTTTYEAIEKFILPPPLKVDRDLPPEVRVMYFTSRQCRGYDGRPTPYHAVMFMANATRNGRTASAGWEYVDALYGDKSDMDIMGPWSVYFGMLKKMANITFLPITANEFEITVDRRGTRLITMRLTVGDEVSPEELQKLNDANVNGTFTVREIPNVTYSALSERSICWSPGNETRLDRAWHADNGFIEFGGLELDPLDEIPVLGISRALCYLISPDKRIFNAMEVFEELPRKP